MDTNIAKKAAKYIFYFSINPPLSSLNLLLPNGVKEIRNNNSVLSGIEIEVASTDENEAYNIANERAEKLFSMLRLFYFEHFSFKCKSWRKIEKDHETLVLNSEIQPPIITWSIANSKPIDLTNALNFANKKLLRQLEHFHNANSSTDIVQQYREYYQVLEQESSQINFTEKALRHALSHPQLNDKKVIEEVEKIFGTPYFDPLSNEHKLIVKNYTRELRAKALTLLKAKIVDPANLTKNDS